MTNHPTHSRGLPHLWDMSLDVITHGTTLAKCSKKSYWQGLDQVWVTKCTFFSSTEFKVNDLYFMWHISYVTVEEEMWTVQVNASGVIMDLKVKESALLRYSVKIPKFKRNVDLMAKVTFNIKWYERQEGHRSVSR